jgi:hypothetical protein
MTRYDSFLRQIPGVKMTQKKVTIPFLNLRSGEYSDLSDADMATIRYNLALGRLEASIDGGPYQALSGSGGGNLYNEIIGAISVTPYLDGYLPYVDGYSTELGKITVQDLVALVGAGGGVSSVGLDGGTTGLTFSGTNPITTSGTLTLTGNLGAANGGTGLSSPGALNNVLTSDGAGGWTSSAPSSTAPGGAVNNVQLNDGAGDFAGYAAFTFDNAITEMLVGSGAAHSIRIAPVGSGGSPLIESDDSMKINVDNLTGSLGLQVGGIDIALVGGDDGYGMSYLQTQAGVRLETQGELWIKASAAPALAATYGKLWANSAADARPYWIDETGEAYNLTLDRFNTLTPAASVTINASPSLPVFNSLALNQDTTFTTFGLGDGRSASVRVICDASTRTLTFPSGPTGWTWLGSGPPASLEAGDVGYLSITAYGTADTDVVAAWSYENMPAVVTGSGVSNRVAFWSSNTDLTSDADLTYDSTTNALTVGTVIGVRRTASGDTGFALAGAGDSDTGIVFNQWGVGANTLSIYANGSQSAYFTQTRLVSGALGGANLFMGTGTAALPQYSGTGDTATGFFIQTVAGVSASGVARQTWSTTGSVVNDDGNNFDFRVESQGNANMLFVDASANAVGIGTGTPSSLLSVGASSQFQVDSSGNLARINDIPYVFPPAQGAAGTILTNDGYGALSWTEGAAQATSAPISTKSSNYTLTTADGTILVNAASGGITITLPAAASAAESIFTIKKKDVTFNMVTVAAAGAELIDGAATYPLSTQYEAIKIQSDGSAWWII